MKDQSGRLVNTQPSLKDKKKLSPAQINQDESLKELLGKPVKDQLELKEEKKSFPTEVILVVLKDQPGKLVRDQL